MCKCPLDSLPKDLFMKNCRHEACAQVEGLPVYCWQTFDTIQHAWYFWSGCCVNREVNGPLHRDSLFPRVVPYHAMEQRAEMSTLNACIAASKANKALARAARAAAAAASAAYGATGQLIDPTQDRAPAAFDPAALLPSSVPLAPLFFQPPYRPPASPQGGSARSHAQGRPTHNPSLAQAPLSLTPGAPLLTPRSLVSQDIFAYQVPPSSSGPSYAGKGKAVDRRF